MRNRLVWIYSTLIVLAAGLILPVVIVSAQQATEIPVTEEPVAEVDLDTLIVSYAKSFTISYPSQLLDATSVENTPNNVTLTNNWNIFSDAGIQLNDGDFLVAVDYYADIQTMSEALGGLQLNLESIARAMHDASPATSTDVTPITAGEYAGFAFDTQQEGALFFRYAYLDVREGQYASFLFLTSSQAQMDNLTPMFNAMMASFHVGMVLDRVAPKDLVLSEMYEREDGFKVPYPAGWRVEAGIVGSTEFVLVTKGQVFNLANPPAEGEPAAIIAYGTLTDLELTVDPDPQVNASVVVQYITQVDPTLINRATIKGYPAALAYNFDVLFDNTFAAVMRDETHFIAANIFTAPNLDPDFAGIVIEMLTQATWDDITLQE